MSTPDGLADRRSPTSLQDEAHSADHDYADGSPHLAHTALNRKVVARVRSAVTGVLEQNPQAKVLEIGAGHGAFSDFLLAAGAEVTLTEMSRASATTLQRRYASNAHARVVFDATGGLDELRGERFDMVLASAVLHHIPDYLAAVRSWVGLINQGGTFVTFQDPLWYPSQRRRDFYAHRAGFYLWRLGRGDLRNGLRSYLRRRRGSFDEANPRDMVEYHVLRSGCDQHTLADLLAQEFSSVQVWPYWSTPSHYLQQLGARCGLVSDFGLLANGRN